MIPLFLDIETYSETPITRGTYKYAENAEVIMWQYAIADSEVVIFGSANEKHLSMLMKLVTSGEYEIVIHNSNFDRNVIKYATGYDIPTNRVFDTMACAMAHSLPGGLDILCEILEIPLDKSKDKNGKALINLFCKPQKDGRRATPVDNPDAWEAFTEYGRRDIEAMREVFNRLPRWNFREAERALWELDQRINDRGVCCDIELATAAIRACTNAKVEADSEVVRRTGGAVSTTNRRDVLLTHILEEYGVALPDMTKATLERRIDDPDLPVALRELLALRLDSSKTSVSKYKRAVDGVNADGRLRGLLQFCGALRTGRWSGRLFQPQNMSRGTVHGDALDAGIEALKAEAEDLL